MGRHILAALLGGMMVVGVSTAFAEEAQLTDQDVLKAWGVAPMEVEQIAETTPQGAQVLTDEDLDEINAAGPMTQMRLRFGIITNQYNTWAAITPCGTLIGVCFKGPRAVWTAQ